MSISDPKNENRMEHHGCIVCGKVHSLLVVYTPAGKLVGCAVTDGDGHPVPDDTRPLVACNRHTAKEIETALAKHYPGKEQEEDQEDK